MTIPSIIKDCAVKINGNEKILGVAEFSIPEITFGEEEINVLGLGRIKETIVSMPEAMTTTMKFLGVDETALKIRAGKGINLILAAAIQVLDENENSSEIPLYATIKGTVKSHKFGNIGPNGKLEPEVEINLTYFKLEINGKIQYEIDQRNNALILDGEDLRAGVKAILG